MAAEVDDDSQGPRVYAGRYESETLLGKGAGGSVYRAEDLHNDRRRVGLKVLSAEQCEGVEGKMLRREFEILTQVHHPHLVRVYDYGTLEDGGVYLAEEYIDGASLQDVRGLLGDEALIDVTRQVLLGLSYLHGMGMIHRDVKPGNIMLRWLDDGSARPMAKLVDFGLSTSDPRGDTMRGGTRSYMAPEIIAGDRGEARSDLFSLGVSLYYALSGTLPFGPRGKDDPPPTEEDLRPPAPHQYDHDMSLSLSRFTMVLLRQVDGVAYRDAGEALHALVRDTDSSRLWPQSGASSGLDVAAVPVLRGYFDRGTSTRREVRRDELVEALSEGGAGRMHLICGARRVGKSRLLDEVRANAKLDGELVFSVECEEGMRAWELVHRLFARLLELGGSRQIEELDYYKPYLLVLEQFSSIEGEITGEVAGSVDSEWIRRAFDDATAALAPHDVVMFVEDLYAADPASRQFLSEWYEGDSDWEAPHLVATTRDQPSLESSFLSEGRAELYELEGLQPIDVRHFFWNQLELVDVAGEWLDDVAAAADGRPAYLQELCRALVEDGGLRRKTGGSWEIDLGALEAFELPESVDGLLRRRVSSAGPGAREILELLVLADRPVPWEWVREHAASEGESMEEVDRRLDALCRRDLVRMTLESGDRYLQPVTPELERVVGDLMNPSWKRRIHRTVGDRTVDRWREGEVGAAAAADQFDEGGREGCAAKLYEAAGDACWRRANFGRAHDRYRAARARMGQSAAGAFLLLKLARVYLNLYERGAMESALEKAGAVAERTALDWLMYTTFVSAVELSRAAGDDGAARAWLERLEDCLPTMSRQASVLAHRSRLAFADGRLEEANELGERALGRARHFGERSQLSSILSSLGEIADWRGDHGRATDRFESALEIGGMGEDLERARALSRYAASLRRRGAERRAGGLLEEALEILSRGHRPDLWVRGLLEMGRCRAAVAEYEASSRYCSDASVFARALGDEVLSSRVRFARAEIGLRVCESVEDSIRAMERAARALRTVERSETARPYFVDMLYRYGRCVQSLDPEKGRGVLERAAERSEEMGVDLPEMSATGGPDQ